MRELRWRISSRKAVDELRRAIRLEDALNYGEPPDWIMPAGVLGAILLINGDAAEAEKAFRAGLKQYPRSGRCLFGLRISLKAQNNAYAAELVDQEFRAAGSTPTWRCREWWTYSNKPGAEVWGVAHAWP